MPSEAFEARLVSGRMLSPSVRELVFERCDDRPLSFRPGQWVNVVWPEVPGGLKRAYSIASAPDDSGRFVLAVTRVANGPGSERLHALREGETVRVVGPSGLFTREAHDPRPAVFVGTGTGVTPLLSMVRAAIGAGSHAPLRMLFGFRHEADVLYRDELEALAARAPNVSLHVTLSSPPPGYEGLRGYVQAHLAQVAPELAPELAPASGTNGPSPSDPAHLYVCGLE
jgi:CDP-4-dehydro-6-deoxyglucose reductase